MASSPLPHSISGPAIVSSSIQSLTSSTGPSIVSSASGFPVTTFPPPKSVDDIQEFKPGIPWQPRAQPTEPAQLYAKQSSLPSGLEGKLNTSTFSMPMPSLKTNSPFAFPQSTAGTATKSQSSNTKFSRQHSGGSFYGTYPGSSSGIQPIGSQPGSTYYQENRQSWTPQMPESRGGGVTYSQSQNRSSYPGASRNPQRGSSRTIGPLPGPPPFGSQAGGIALNHPPLPTSQSFGISNPSGAPGRKPQNRFPPQQPPNPPQGSYPFKNGGFGGPGLPQPPSQFVPSAPGQSPHMDNRNWGPDPSVSLAKGWGQDTPLWNGYKLHAPSPSYASPPTQPNTSTHPYALTSSLDSFRPAGGSRTWGQEDLRIPPHSKGSMMSPEPTFAEWQAGKKAHLSVFKIPSNPPSKWLIIKNVNSQVSPVQQSTHVY